MVIENFMGTKIDKKLRQTRSGALKILKILLSYTPFSNNKKKLEKKKIEIDKVSYEVSLSFRVYD